MFQHALRLLAFRQIHKVLAMEPLPPPRFPRQRFNNPRKRRHTGSGEATEEGKLSGRKFGATVIGHWFGGPLVDNVVQVLMHIV